MSSDKPSFSSLLKEMMDAKDMSWGKLTEALNHELQLSTVSKGAVYNIKRDNAIFEDWLAAILVIFGWKETLDEIKQKYEIRIKPSESRKDTTRSYSRMISVFDAIAAPCRRRDDTNNIRALFANMDHRDWLCLITLTTTPLEHRINRFTELSIGTADAVGRRTRVVYFFPTERLSNELQKREGYDAATSHQRFIEDFGVFRDFVRRHLIDYCHMPAPQAEEMVYRYLGYHLYDDTMHVANALETVGVFGTAAKDTAKNVRVTRRMQDDETGFIITYPRSYLVQARTVNFLRTAIVEDRRRLEAELCDLQMKNYGDESTLAVVRMKWQVELARDMDATLNASDTHIDANLADGRGSSS